MSLLGDPENRSLSALADRFGVTDRTIRSDVKQINRFLQENGLRPLEYEKEGRIVVHSDFSRYKNFLKYEDLTSYKLSYDERIVMEFLLLVMSVDYLTISSLAEKLVVSRSTIVKDLRGVESMMKGYDLTLDSQPSKGLRVLGDERNIRQALIDQCIDIEANQGESLFTLLSDAVILCRSYSATISNIVSEVQQELGISFSNMSRTGLCYYLNVTVGRNKQGSYIQQYEDTTNYGAAYACADSIIRSLSAYCGIQITVGEIDFLAKQLEETFPFVSTAKDMKEAVRIQVCTKRLIADVSQQLGIKLEQDYKLYEYLSNHLLSIYHAAIEGEKENPLLRDVEETNNELISCIRGNLGEIEACFGRKLNSTEITYIAIHFLAGIERLKSIREGFDVILVCNSGVGTSQLIAAKLKTVFNVNVVAIMPLLEASSLKATTADLIVSTIPVYDAPIEVVQVSTKMTGDDYAAIGNELDKLQCRKRRVRGQDVEGHPRPREIMQLIEPVLQEKAPQQSEELSVAIWQKLLDAYIPPTEAKEDSEEGPLLCELLRPEFVRLGVSCKTWIDAVRASAEPLLTAGYITEGYVDSIISTTEELGAYYLIAPEVAMPHANIEDGSLKTGMSLIRLDEPVPFHVRETNDEWQDVSVHYVITLCTETPQSHLRAFFHLLTLLHDTDLLAQIDEAGSSEAVCQRIRAYEFDLDDY